MSSVVLYHNPRWGKSRRVVALLEENDVVFKVIEYLKNPLGKDEVLQLSKKLKKKPIDFIRKNDLDFKNNILDKDILNDNKMAELITQFPKIMERPILVVGKNAVIGRPPENVLNLLN